MTPRSLIVMAEAMLGAKTCDGYQLTSSLAAFLARWATVGGSCMNSQESCPFVALAVTVWMELNPGVEPLIK